MRKFKLRLTVIALLACIMTILSQGTLAYYSTVGTATNVVTSGDIRLIIHETSGDGSPYPEEGIYVIPGQIISKRVTIENDCTHPFYLRVKLVNGIDSSELSAEECFGIDLNSTDWTLRDDGYIYYNYILDAGTTTSPVFTEVEIVGSKVDTSFIGKTLSLTVNAYAVQSENNPSDAPWDAVGWPAD